MGRALQQYKKLFDDLRKKGPRPIYLLHGPEEFIKKEFLSELIHTALAKENLAFNLDILHGDEFERDTFDDRMSSFPLFADRRMVVLKRFEALSTTNKDFVLDRLERVPASLTVVIETSVGKADTARDKRLKKIADTRGVSFRFQYLSEEETVQRIEARLRKEGLTFDSDALDLLIASVGTQLIDLTNETDKIVLSVGPEKRVDRGLVAEVVGKYRTENVFAFLDRVGKADIGAVVSRMNRVIDGGEEPIFVMAMLLRRILLLLEVKTLVAEHGARARSPQVLAGLLSGHTSPYYAANLLEQSSGIELETLYGYLNNLRWADMTLKSTSISARTVLEEALLASSLKKTLPLNQVRM